MRAQRGSLTGRITEDREKGQAGREGEETVCRVRATTPNNRQWVPKFCLVLGPLGMHQQCVRSSVFNILNTPCDRRRLRPVLRVSSSPYNRLEKGSPAPQKERTSLWNLEFGPFLPFSRAFGRGKLMFQFSVFDFV